MMSSRKAVFLVGLTILLAGAWAVATLVYLRGALTARRFYHVEAVFPDALGIREQARVYLAGVEVGEVQKVWLTPDLQARARLALRRDVSIPEDTVAVVMSPGIAGVDKLIALMPGKSPRRAEEGTVLRGTKELGISDIAPVAQQTLQEVQQLVRTANTLLNDPEMQASIRQTLRNVERASERLNVLTDQAGSLLASTGRSLDAVVRDARSSTRLLPQVLADLQELLEQSRELLRTAQHATESLARFVSDEQLQQSLRDTAREVNALTVRLNRIAEDVSKYTGDEELRENVRATVAEARATLAEARGATERISRFVERIIQPGNLSLSPMEVSLDLYALLRDDTFRTDLALTLPYRENRFFTVGLFDAAESNRFILQYGASWGDRGSLRYGLYASKLGVGLDWRLSPRLQLRADLFNTRQLQLNTRARWQMGADWSLWAGVDGLFRDNQPVIGLQITR